MIRYARETFPRELWFGDSPVHEGLHSPGEAGNVSRIHEKSRQLVGQDLRNTADAGCEYRAPGRKAFENYAAKRLLLRWMNNDVSRMKGLHYVRLHRDPGVARENLTGRAAVARGPS